MATMGGLPSNALPDEEKYQPITSISSGDMGVTLEPTELTVKEGFTIGKLELAPNTPEKCDYCGTKDLSNAGYFALSPKGAPPLTLCIACLKKSIENAIGIKPVGEKRRPCGKCDRMHYEVHLVKLGDAQAAAWFCDPCYFALIDQHSQKDPERRNLLL